jgi:hypothetical protein
MFSRINGFAKMEVPQSAAFIPLLHSSVLRRVLADRVWRVRARMEPPLTTGQDVFDIELIFVQFRKILELIAFSTLTANRGKYSLAHAGFAKHWKAKSMLEAVGKLNPDFYFYPVALRLPEVLPNGVKQLEPLAEGFLTKSEFEVLVRYLVRNTSLAKSVYAQDPVTQIRFSPARWVLRIQTLLAFHKVDLVNETKWKVEIPNEGSVWLSPAVPVDSIGHQATERK